MQQQQQQQQPTTLLVQSLVVGLFTVTLFAVESVDGIARSPANAVEQQPAVTEQVNNRRLTTINAEQSVQDEAAIRAVENYEFKYLRDSDEAAAPYKFSSFQHDLDKPELLASATDHANQLSHHSGHHNKQVVGYSVGGPLVNIAQGAAQQARRFEKNQPAAAAQAAYVAKNRLGQSAGLSAATAAAAFAGKQIILRGLEQQVFNAQRALEGEKTQLQQAQRASVAAASTAQQAMQQVQAITTALNAAQATSQHASTAAAAAAAELAAQTAMVGAAKARLQALEEQLHHARIDFEAAQRANREATSAAEAAQNNAALAAAHAAEIAAAANAMSKNQHQQQQKLYHQHEPARGDDCQDDSCEDEPGPSSEKFERPESKEQDQDEEVEDENRYVSVAVPSVSANASAASTLERAAADAAATDRLERQALQRSSTSPAADRLNSQGPTLISIRHDEDELYDFYDSFPY